MKFKLIDQAKAAFPITRLCRLLGVSPSGYFAWKDRPASRRQQADLVLLAHAWSAFALSNGTYGSPRMTRELQDNGFAASRRRTARLMRDNDLRARQKHRFKRTTDSEHSWPVAPNITDQDFAASGPNQKWGVDIFEMWTLEGWIYRAVVIDPGLRRGGSALATGRWLGGRQPVGNRRLAIAAFQAALTMRCPLQRLIHNSDRGSQHCSVDYVAELPRNAVRISMSGKGNRAACAGVGRGRCHGRDVPQDAEIPSDLANHLLLPGRCDTRHCSLHRWLLQPRATSFGT